MSRRSQRYTLDVGTDQDFELTTPEWKELLSGGWIERTGYKTARPRRGVVAWIRGGDLWLTPLARIPAVTAGWFLLRLFRVCVISAGQSPKIRAAHREWALFDMERETQNEALLWRTSRNTRGRNSFSWIPAGHKAEILRALRPEMSGEAIG
jgi:hypothetical protein